MDFDRGWTQGRDYIEDQNAIGPTKIASKLKDRGPVKDYVLILLQWFPRI